MIDTITLPPVGDIQVVKPSLAASLDMVSTWGEKPTRAQIGRLCAAAIGICCPHVKLPAYSMIDCHPIAYGGHCLEKLLRLGVTASDIYAVGVQLIDVMAESLPSEAEVKEAENFTKSEAGN